MLLEREKERERERERSRRETDREAYAHGGRAPSSIDRPIHLLDFDRIPTTWRWCVVCLSLCLNVSPATTFPCILHTTTTTTTSLASLARIQMTCIYIYKYVCMTHSTRSRVLSVSPALHFQEIKAANDPLLPSATSFLLIGSSNPTPAASKQSIQLNSWRCRRATKQQR